MSEDRVVLITGSGTGLGAELIRSFAARGFSVVINYLNDGEADSLYHEIEGAYGQQKVMKFQADVADRAAIKAMYGKIIDSFGRVDDFAVHGLKEYDQSFIGTPLTLGFQKFAYIRQNLPAGSVLQARFAAVALSMFRRVRRTDLLGFDD